MFKQLGKSVHKLSHREQHETLLVAIASQQNGYRLCWALNNCLNISLSDADDFRVEHENLGELFSAEPQTLSFPSFFYEDEENNATYRLLYNKHSDGYLIRSLKNVDFLLVVTAAKDAIDKKRLLEGIRQTELTLMSFFIETQKLMSKERKILEF